MAENTETSEITNNIVEKTYTDPETGKFVKGNPGGGRPKGSNNFETDFDVAVEEIAKENGMTRSEARKLLLKVAFKQAKDGNYSFYKDIHDRIYGQAKNTSDIKLSIGERTANKDLDKLLDYAENEKNQRLPEDKGNEQENKDLSGRDIGEQDL